MLFYSELAFLETQWGLAAAVHVSVSTVSSRCSYVFKCGRTSSTFKAECIWLVSSYVPLLFFLTFVWVSCALCACVYYILTQLYCSLLLGVWIFPWKIPWTGWYPATPFSVYLTVLWLGVLFGSLVSERAMVLKAPVVSRVHGEAEVGCDSHPLASRVLKLSTWTTTPSKCVSFWYRVSL